MTNIRKGELWRRHTLLLTRKLNMSFMKKITFHLAKIRILGSMEYEKNRNDFSVIMNKKDIKLKKYYA